MSMLWEKLLRPMMFRLDAERAHEIGLKALRLGLASPFVQPGEVAETLVVKRFGLSFSSPIGLAAGFDKNGLVVDQLSSLGFGFVEVGTVTFQPQPGNPKPRMFRLPEDNSLLNRLGFNNVGAVAVAENLGRSMRPCVIGVNIGRNKDVPNDAAIENYVAAFELVHPVADYVAVNVSSPNTPNLRELQQSSSIDALIEALQLRNRELGSKPLLIKIAPDLIEPEIEALVDVCLIRGVDGIIATNTTISRVGLDHPGVRELGEGGISGRPLASVSNEIIASIFRRSNGKLPIVGVGGVFSGRDAFDKIAAGASLVQAYTGFVYRGPNFAFEVAKELAQELEERGFASVDAVVGSAAERS